MAVDGVELHVLGIRLLYEIEEKAHRRRPAAVGHNLRRRSRMKTDAEEAKMGNLRKSQLI